MKKIAEIKIGGNNPPVKYETEIDLAAGDYVIVEGANGAEWGIVSATPTAPCKKSGSFNMVLRTADEADIKLITHLKNQVGTAVAIAQEKADAKKLDMKFLCGHYTLEADKVILHFTSPGRVDFRELAKELAYTLRTRIEFRQVGPRDEVKIHGALGPCGQVCCCVRFQEEAQNITIKMAKNQNISLNPQKINGMCNRLLCCLAYENDHYAEMQDKMPRYGVEVATPDGRGIAQDNSILKETVNVKFPSQDGSPVRCYKLCDVKCKNQG